MLKVIDATTFEQFSKVAINANFEQTVQMGELHTLRQRQIEYVAYEIDNDIKAAALVTYSPIFAGVQLNISKGPIYTDSQYLSAFLSALKQYAKNNNILEVMVSSYDTYQTFANDGTLLFGPNAQLMQIFIDQSFEHEPFHVSDSNAGIIYTYRKDLTGLDEKSLIKSFDKNMQYSLKKAKSFGITIRTLEKNELTLFKKVTETTSSRHEFDDKPLSYYEQLYDAFKDTAEFTVATLNFAKYQQSLIDSKTKIQELIDKLQAEMAENASTTRKEKQLREYIIQRDSLDKRLNQAAEFVSKYQDEEVILSGSLFVYFDYESYYLFSGSYSHFNQFYAPSLLQEHVMLKSIDRRIPKYNFLGVKGVFDGSDGLLKFKGQFDGYVDQRLGIFKYSPHPIKHQFIQFVKKLLKRT